MAWCAAKQYGSASDLPRKRAEPNETNDDKPFDFRLSGQTFSRIERFLDFWKAYPERDGLKGYLYRVASPWIDSRQTGKRESSIQIWENDTQVPAADELLRLWGSGKFNFLLNDRMKPEGVQQLAKCTFSLDDADVPAVYNPSDLVLHGEAGEKNRPYIERWLAAGWSVVEGQTNEVYRDRRGAGGAKVPFRSLRPPVETVAAEKKMDAETLRTIIEKTGAGQNELVAGLLQLLAADRAKPQPDALAQALTILEKIQPRNDPNQVAIMGHMVELVKAQTRPAAASDPMRSTRDVLGFVRELRESGMLGESGAGGAGGFWPAAFQALPSVLQFLAPSIQSLMLRNAAAGLAGAVPPLAAAVPAAAAVPPLAAAVPGAAAAPAAEGLPVELAGMGGEMFGLPPGVGVADMVRIGKNAMRAFQRGVDGEGFAHALVCGSESEELIYSKLVEAGKAELFKLLQFAGTVSPEIAAVVNAREADLSAWLDSFMAYADADTGDDTDRAA